jgi:hypothetical protein
MLRVPQPLIVTEVFPAPVGVTVTVPPEIAAVAMAVFGVPAASVNVVQPVCVTVTVCAVLVALAKLRDVGLALIVGTGVGDGVGDGDGVGLGVGVGVAGTPNVSVVVAVSGGFPEAVAVNVTDDATLLLPLYATAIVLGAETVTELDGVAPFVLSVIPVVPDGIVTVMGFGKLAPTMIAPLASSSLTTSCAVAAFPGTSCVGLSAMLTALASGARLPEVLSVIVIVVVPAPSVARIGPVESGVPVPSAEAYVVTMNVSVPMYAGTDTLHDTPPATGVHPLVVIRTGLVDPGGAPPLTDCKTIVNDAVPDET